MEAPEGKLVNGVGAGDSMVAGFIAGWLGYVTGSDSELLNAFKLGIAAGSASAYSEYLATKEEVDELYSKL